jgi:hypothetical protein
MSTPAPRASSTRGTPSAFPLLAQTEQDVVEGVRLARERGWKVGIKSGLLRRSMSTDDLARVA